MKLIAHVFLFAALLPILAPAQFLMRPARHGSAAVNTVTQDFNSYADSTSLATFSGWTVTEGAFTTGTGLGTHEVTSDGPGLMNSAIYEPAGFTCAANHQVEVTIDVWPGRSNSQAQGAACAIQASGSNYHCYADGSANVYFGFAYSDGTPGEYLNTSVGSFNPVGFKIRMTTSGASPQAVTAEYNNGSGWVIPSGWNARVFPAGVPQLTGGKAGLSGYSAESEVTVTSITITNQ